MKRMWIGVGLLLVMLGLGVFLTMCFERLHTPLANMAYGAAEASIAEDWEKAEALAKDAKAQWERIRRFVAVAADHEPLEEMDSLFARLQIFAQKKMPAHFAAECTQLARLAQAIAESQSITWWAFF